MTLIFLCMYMHTKICENTSTAIDEARKIRTFAEAENN